MKLRHYATSHHSQSSHSSARHLSPSPLPARMLENHKKQYSHPVQAAMAQINIRETIGGKQSRNESRSHPRSTGDYMVFTAVRHPAAIYPDAVLIFHPQPPSMEPGDGGTDHFGEFAALAG